jgi:hypothetical protein
MRQVVGSVMRCKCLDWNECGKLASSVLERGQEAMPDATKRAGF